MIYCESQLDILKCDIVFDGKHVRIICPKRAMMKFIAVRMATLRCILATVENSQISPILISTKRKIE
jgi:hypothetical protein